MTLNLIQTLKTSIYRPKHTQNTKTPLLLLFFVSKYSNTKNPNISKKENPPKTKQNKINIYTFLNILYMLYNSYI